MKRAQRVNSAHNAGASRTKIFQKILVMSMCNSYDDANVCTQKSREFPVLNTMLPEKNILCLTLPLIFSNHHELPLMDRSGGLCEAVVLSGEE